MSFEEYIKFLLIDAAKKRKQRKNSKPDSNKRNKPSAETLFGLFPLSVKMLFKK